MNQFKNTISLSLVVVCMLAGMIGVAQAQRRNDRDIRDAVRSLNSKIDDFEYNLRYQMQSSSAANGQVSDISDDVRNLRDSVRKFEDNFDRRRENRDDVNSVIDAAKRIETFLDTNSQNRRVTDDWSGIKKQIERLGSNYGITPSWDEFEPENVRDQRDPVIKNTVVVGLTGTYDLDAGRSENIDDIVADTSLSGSQRDDLKEKLTPPQQIALDVRSQQVTLATSTASPITITADGRDKTEKDSAGRTVRLRATLTGDTLTVSSLGGETDYSIKFVSVSDGRVMKVSRRITTDYLSQTVFADSVYNKSDTVARLGIPAGGGGFDPPGDYSDQ